MDSRFLLFGGPLGWRKLGLFAGCIACKPHKNPATGFGVRVGFVPEAVTFIFRGDAEAQNMNIRGASGGLDHQTQPEHLRQAQQKLPE